jgi:uncharacterized membrane protein YdjX (TVP38/TMEM64 family)
MRRVAIVVATLLLAGAVAWSAGLHQQIVHIVAQSEPFLARHPIAGPLLFIGLAALSAAVAFFSSALLIPFGVQVWGEGVCFVLLWLGWFLGGCLTYGIGRGLGQPMMRYLLSPRRAAEYQARIPTSHAFLPVLLAQLVLPSEAVGYLCGLLRVPPRTFLPALALAELPYALGTVLLGTAFVHRQHVVLFAFAVGGLVLLGWLHWRRGKTRSHSPVPPTHAP